jgi:hypothetical protein
MRLLLVSVLSLVASLPVFGSVGAQSMAPANLAVPSGHFTAYQLMAEGVQIYGCQARTDNPAWTFRAPEATLWSTSGEFVGTHYAGPTWEGLDGSKIVAAGRANADSPDPGAIPWLLLEAQSNTGVGIFGTVSYVQRLDTTGGRAPADGCGASSVGQELRVPYTAVYTFSYPTAQ